MLDDLRRIVRALRESSRDAEQQLGVTGAQLFVLHVLKTQGVLSLNELAARTHTHQSTVSAVVKRLVEVGLVTRVTSSADARRVELSVTERGRTLLQRAPFAAQDRLIVGIQRMPVEKRRSLVASLRTLVNEMGLDDQSPTTMFFEDEGSLVPQTRK